MAVSAPDQLAITPPAFTRAYRIIPSRYPPVGVFDDLAAPEELDVLFELEAQTNNRLADALGLIDLIDPADRLVGPGTTPIMAAFTHPAIGGSRYSDGSYGIYYCADSANVAVAETAYHRARFLRASGEPACTIEMRLYTGTIRQSLYNGLDGALPDSILDPNDYTQSQRWGKALHDAKAYGLTYPSVRHAGGQCAALFRPTAIGSVTPSTHFHYRFDGRDISNVFRVSGNRRLFVE